VSDLLRPFVLAWRYWPQIVACYLAGVVARRAAIEAAAYVGHNNPFWAALIMPFAGLATLGSYVAMFLAVRRGVPVLARLSRPSLRGVDLFSTIIVPFFAVYLAWQLFKEDWLAYQARALDYQVAEAFSGIDINALPVPESTWWVIGAALIARYPLNYFASRLPRWLTAVRVYVDSLWVFLVLSYSLSAGFTLLVNPKGWVAKRRIVVWFNSTRAELFSNFKPLQLMWDGMMWALKTVFGGAGVPLMWLAVVGIVYGVSTRADWRAAARRTVGERGTAFIDKRMPTDQLKRRWGVLPSSLRGKVSDYMLSKTGRYKPVVDSARLILHGGVAALSAYVLAYLALAWLDMSGSFYGASHGHGYLFRGMAWLLRQHGAEFLSALTPTLGLISLLIIEPLRIALIVTAFGYCWRHAAAAQSPNADEPSQREAQQDRVVHAGNVDRGGGHIAGQQEAELQDTGVTAEFGGAVADREAGTGDILGLPTPPPVGDDSRANPGARGTRPVDGDYG
jgi:hypothetical protein